MPIRAGLAGADTASRVAAETRPVLREAAEGTERWVATSAEACGRSKAAEDWPAGGLRSTTDPPIRPAATKAFVHDAIPTREVAAGKRRIGPAARRRPAERVGGTIKPSEAGEERARS